MEINIRALSPDMASDFINYLDNLDFSHQPHWKGCYCQFFHTACSDLEWANTSPQQNRISAEQRIQQGSMHGYLAYLGDTCVGWCNANKLQAYSRLANLEQLQEYDGNTGLVICFVIHPDFRKQGIARQLLAAAICGFQETGSANVLGMPFEWIEHPESRYHGSRRMFEEAGFYQVNKDEQHPLYLLPL